MAAFDLLSRRWAISVLWELRGGPVGFRELSRALPTISSSVLATRLRELTEVQITETTNTGKYSLTAVGVDLLYALAPLKAWSHGWARQLGVEGFELDQSAQLDG
ncbi:MULTISPECIES: winged helix-turn-helix transcriptional regulator [Mycolicibacterium]|uniref:winged helix-turn-helix transcriptional regulator n=1 Tax=Mycolicibacterium TaxID=1866885 RepID=UPI001CFC0788|nr:MULTISPECIES: winged helix-turn-helix transcriptional regulator [Mycolicibacterium]UCZ60487.1 helix-turn-helix transcriptional regulator [Mycolicibacterium phocaicum]